MVFQGTYLLGTERPNEIRQEFRAYTPEQARAMGKTMGPLNKGTIIDWIAWVGEMHGLNADDVVALAREGMSPEDFGAMPNEVQLATIGDCVEIFKRLYTFYWPSSSLAGKYYTEKQNKHERPKRYILRKKALFRMAGADQLDTPEFREELIKGLLPTLRVTMGAVDHNLHTLHEIEDRVRAVYEIHREDFPAPETRKEQSTRTSGFKGKPAKVAAVKEKETKGREAPKKSSSPQTQRPQRRSREEQDRYESQKLRGIIWRRLLKYENLEQIDGLDMTELMSKLAAHEGGNLPLEGGRPDLQ